METLSYTEFTQRYTPARFGGVLPDQLVLLTVGNVEEAITPFATEPVDFDALRSVLDRVHAHVWTYVDNNDGKRGYFVNGLYKINAIGYFYTLEPTAERGQVYVDLT